ncbi:MAG: IPTL-CTERM sorting domain-containing protein [Planctomycetes bacterium]|nr:IPTL-CTERM sorting domain-containing protein [Planctomycetota bacterium]
MRGKKAIYLLSAIVPASLLCAFVDAQEQSAKSNSHGEANVAVRSDGVSHLEELVTGDVEHLGNVVAGYYGATFKVYFTPRPPLPGTEPSLAYPAGWSINGQKLTVSRGGFTSAWITQVDDWDVDQNGYPLLHSFQDKIDAQGFLGASASPPNPGCDLAYPASTFACQKTCAGGSQAGNPCTTNANCPGSTCADPCPTLMGETGTKCGNTVAGKCDWGWQNTTRADWVFAANAPSDQVPVAFINSSTGPNFAGSTRYGTGMFDTGGRFYTGTLLLPVPDCAKGVYTFKHKLDETFADADHGPESTGIQIGITAYISGVLEIRLGSCCTDFTSPSSAMCTDEMTLNQCDALSSSNLHIFRADADCTTPCSVECVTAAGCDDHKFCTEDSCTPDGHCLYTHTDAVCDDGVDCTMDFCVAASDSCLHTPVDALCDDGVDCTIDTCTEPNGVCIHTPVDSVCDDELYCNGVEVCTLTGCAPGEPPCGFGETCDETDDSCGLTPIPTVSQWGLAVLTLLLAIGAKIGFRRRRISARF